VIAVDGKVLRGAKLADGRQVHLLSAYDTVSGIVLLGRRRLTPCFLLRQRLRHRLDLRF
jgi:hypothetical protein